MYTIEIPIFVRKVIDRLEAKGFEAWIVGGCIRDFLRGCIPHDWDIATSAQPVQTISVFEDWPVYLTGIRHGTIMVHVDGHPVEITTFRTESVYSDKRRPDTVKFVTQIADDLARRDFTINAMAYHPVRGLYDRFGGKQDLEAGLLRAVGDPDRRFCEDALRILRGVRFLAKTGFAIECNTAQAMRRQLSGLDAVANERILSELNEILTGQYVGRALRSCRDIIAAVLPEVAPMFGLWQHNPHHRYDVWEHTVRAVEAVPNDLVLRWTLLLHDSGKPYSYTVDEQGIGHFRGHAAMSATLARQALTRLRAPRALREQVERLVQLHDYLLGQEQKIVQRRMAKLGEDTVRRLLRVKKGDCSAQGIFSIHLAELWQTEQLVETICAADGCFCLKDLAIDGHAVRELGFCGPEIGLMLRRLLDQVIDGQIPNQRAALYGLAKLWKENQDV